MNKTLRPRLSAIVAMSENRVIGLNNKMPWHLPADLSHFKTITSGHPIIMGRKTFESIGRPLPNRTNIILSRDPSYAAPGCQVVNSLSAALDLAEGINAEEVFVIGGADIYRQALPLVSRLHLSVVHAEFEGNAFFPSFAKEEWREVNRKEYAADERNAYAISFIEMERVA